MSKLTEEMISTCSTNAIHLRDLVKMLGHGAAEDLSWKVELVLTKVFSIAGKEID